MSSHNLVALVTLLSLLLFMFMIIRTGGARAKSGLKAPATTGDQTYERHFRVLMNTLEGLPIYLGSLWLFAAYWDSKIGQLVAAGAGVVWIIGRVIYMLSYVKDPETRSTGFGITALAMVVLLVGAFAGVIRALLASHGV
jgi:uncharacterized MAPEG superfamily protein